RALAVAGARVVVHLDAHPRLVPLRAARLSPPAARGRPRARTWPPRGRCPPWAGEGAGGRVARRRAPVVGGRGDVRPARVYGIRVSPRAPAHRVRGTRPG